ncbi:MAG: hypothetical protein ABW158_13115 [Candidatus Thiodiazotropha sp. 6PDIVS]
MSPVTICLSHDQPIADPVYELYAEALPNSVQQQKDRLPCGVLLELSWQARKAVKAGGLLRTSCPPPLRGQPEIQGG